MREEKKNRTLVREGVSTAIVLFVQTAPGVSSAVYWYVDTQILVCVYTVRQHRALLALVSTCCNGCVGCQYAGPQHLHSLAARDPRTLPPGEAPPVGGALPEARFYAIWLH